MPLLGKAGVPTGSVLPVGVLVKIGVLIGAVVINNLQLKVLLHEANLLILGAHPLGIQTLM